MQNHDVWPLPYCSESTGTSRTAPSSSGLVSQMGSQMAKKSSMMNGLRGKRGEVEVSRYPGKRTEGKWGGCFARS